MRIRAACRLSILVAAAAMWIVPLAGGAAGAKQEMLVGASQNPVRIVPKCFRHPLRIGMTVQQALESDWCYPNDTRQSTIAPGAIEYWFYAQGARRTGAHAGMILLEDGIVTYFSEAAAN